jgi:hypothetical protein
MEEATVPADPVDETFEIWLVNPVTQKAKAGIKESLNAAMTDLHAAARKSQDGDVRKAVAKLDTYATVLKLFEKAKPQ